MIAASAGTCASNHGDEHGDEHGAPVKSLVTLASAHGTGLFPCPYRAAGFPTTGERCTISTRLAHGVPRRTLPQLASRTSHRRSTSLETYDFRTAVSQVICDTYFSVRTRMRCAGGSATVHSLHLQTTVQQGKGVLLPVNMI